MVLFLKILKPFAFMIISCSQFIFSSDNSKGLDGDVTHGLKDNISSVSDGLINQNKINFLNYDQIPDLRQMDRDPSSLIDRWKIRRAYGSEYYDASSDSAQIILDPSQFNGYRSYDAGIEITLPSNEIVDLNYVYIDSGLFRFTIPFWGSSDTNMAVLLSNTPISMWDSYASFYPSFFNNPNPNPNSFFDILGLFYDGPVYPRYLYSYSLGLYVTGMFPSYRPIETLTIWYDQNTMVQYRGVLNAETDTTVINGNYVDFENRNMTFDSLSIYFTELYNSEQTMTIGDTVVSVLNGSVFPDSVYVPQDSLIRALNYYGIFNGSMQNTIPISLIGNPYDITWVFNEDSTGQELRATLNSFADTYIFQMDTINFTWNASEDSIVIRFEDADPLLLSYGINQDTLYFTGKNVLCNPDTCIENIANGPGPGPVANPIPYDEQVEDFTGLSKINYVSYDFGLSMTNSETNGIIFIGGNNGGLNFLTYSVGHSSHQFLFQNIGSDSLHWSIQSPEYPWLTIDTLAGVTGPYSPQPVGFTIDGSALASDSIYDVEVIINSNDVNNPSLAVNLTIQVNPPDLYMVGLNNNSYTIQEDDSVETTFYVVGPQGNTTFSISGDTSSISGYVVLDDEYIPNSISNYSMRATLFVIPDPNWYGEAVIYVTADNEYDYTDIDTLTVTVNSVFDQIIEPEMVYPPNGHTINFETMLDSIVLSWNGASYPEFETGPGFEYRLRIVQSNENGNIPYNFTDISDTSFTFFPDSSTYEGPNNNYVWSLYTTEQDLPEVLDGQSGVFFVILPAMNTVSDDIPSEFKLHLAYPNPFNPSTTIQYDLPKDSFVTIDIYNMMGRKVKTLLNDQIPAGRRSIVWDGTNKLNQAVSAGTYFYMISTNKYKSTKKLILLK